MKRQQLALVIEGNSTSSTLLRLASIAAELGPIKSSGLQVARRVSNFLRAGYAVASYADLESARIILIRVPDHAIDRIVAEIEQADIGPGHVFILAETWAPTEKLQPLRRLGAHVASLVALPAAAGSTFIAEGDLAAVRQIRRIIDRGDARTIELRTGTKHLLFAAAVLCTAVPTPVFLLAQQALRDAGVAGNQLSSAMEEMFTEALVSILKGARTTWGGPLAEFLKSSHGPYWDRIFQTHPELALKLKQYVEISQSVISRKVSRTHTV